MRKIYLSIFTLFVFSSIAYSQQPFFIDSVYLDSIKQIKINPKLHPALNDTIVYFLLHREIGPNKVYLKYDTIIAGNDTNVVLNDTFTISLDSIVKPSTKTLSHIFNAVYLKYMDLVFKDRDDINYASISHKKIGWISTSSQAVRFLKDTVIKNTVIDLTIRNLFLNSLQEEKILEEDAVLNDAALLSDYFASGFSLSPYLNLILDTLKEEYKLKTKPISLMDASSLTSIKECLDLLKLKAGLIKKDINPLVAFIFDYIPRYFTSAKSSDEIAKPRSSRNSASFSYTSTPKSKIIDVYSGINLIGFINTFPLVSLFLGPVQEIHQYKVNDQDSVSIENWGGAVSGTILWPAINNFRIKGYFYYAKRNDYKLMRKGTQLKSSFSFSFESRDWSRWILPSYEPYGLRCGKTEVASYTWSPIFTYDFIEYGISDSEKLGPLSATINTNLYILDRVIELSGSWKYKLIVNKNTVLALRDFKVYREFAIKLNPTDNKLSFLKPILKDFKITLGFQYQDGLNITSGSNDVIRSLTFGFGF